MKLQAWPKSGPTRRVYINSGRWSVDTWIEPHGRDAGWRLQIKIKDGECTQRRIEIVAEMESQLFDELARFITRQPQSKPLREMQWDDWASVAVNRRSRAV
tara:strand:- start:28576 stop:28878 length:303 start_codon:yes stop_codon:yes gene_type:complete